MESTQREPQLNPPSEQAKDSPRIERFRFTGSGGEYFGIWIVNILLTIVTLGIYSAWAKVRNKQYFYGNTYLVDSSFEYTAQPLLILKGRIVAVILFVAYQMLASFSPLIGAVLGLTLFVLAPWIVMKSLAFNARYSQYRSIPFSFTQNIWDSVKVFVLIPLMFLVPIIAIFVLMTFMGGAEGTPDLSGFVVLASIVLGLIAFLAYPVIVYFTNRYIVDNHNYGGQGFQLRLDSPTPFIKIYLQAAGLLLALGAVFALIFAIAGWSDFLPNAQSTAEQVDLGQVNIAAIGLMYILTLFFYFFIFAFIAAGVYNLTYQNSTLGSHRMRANMTASGLCGIYIGNTIGIILTLGLFIPWAKVRTARYRAEHTAMQVSGSLDEFVATQEEHQNVFGEEIGDVFDLDIGI